MRRTPRLEIGCDALDELLGGGLEHGVVTNVFGGAGAGKTNVCIQAIVSCIRDGEKAVLIDTEGGFSPDRFLQMHDDEEALDDLVMYEPTTFEEQVQAFDEIPDLVAEEDPGIVVVDSLVALYRLQRSEVEEPEDVNTELSRQFSTLSKLARDRDIPVVVTNQVYSPFDAEEDELVGRDIPAYWSKALIELEKAGRGKRLARIRKHRSRPEGMETAFYITDGSLVSEQPDDDRMKIF